MPDNSIIENTLLDQTQKLLKNVGLHKNIGSINPNYSSPLNRNLAIVLNRFKQLVDQTTEEANDLDSLIASKISSKQIESIFHKDSFIVPGLSLTDYENLNCQDGFESYIDLKTGTYLLYNFNMESAQKLLNPIMNLPSIDLGYYLDKSKILSDYQTLVPSTFVNKYSHLLGETSILSAKELAYLHLEKVLINKHIVVEDILKGYCNISAIIREGFILKLKQPFHDYAQSLVNPINNPFEHAEIPPFVSKFLFFTATHSDFLSTDLTEISQIFISVFKDSGLLPQNELYKIIKDFNKVGGENEAFTSILQCIGNNNLGSKEFAAIGRSKAFLDFVFKIIGLTPNLVGHTFIFNVKTFPGRIFFNFIIYVIVASIWYQLLEDPFFQTKLPDNGDGPSGGDGGNGPDGGQGGGNGGNGPGDGQGGGSGDNGPGDGVSNSANIIPNKDENSEAKSENRIETDSLNCIHFEQPRVKSLSLKPPKILINLSFHDQLIKHFNYEKNEIDFSKTFEKVEQKFETSQLESKDFKIKAFYNDK